MTTSNHLNAVYRTSPQQATQTYIRLLEHNYGRSMESFLMRFPIKYFENDEDMV
ncbi:MAG: hypothetical protein LBE56_12545 [Tannerella sp.]|nr:hypothetical protein [Tannerella sp.]